MAFIAAVVTTVACLVLAQGSIVVFRQVYCAFICLTLITILAQCDAVSVTRVSTAKIHGDRARGQELPAIIAVLAFVYPELQS